MLSIAGTGKVATALLALIGILLATMTLPPTTAAFVLQRQPSRRLSPMQLSSNPQNENVIANNNITVVEESTSFIDSIVKTGMKDLNDLQVGDVVVAKMDVPSLSIWRGSGYQITGMYYKGANPETGMPEEIPLSKFNEESAAKRGYQKYLEIYNPRDHRDGPVIVSPEEIGLVTLKSELKEAMLLAIPGFFWVFVAAAFVNWYSSQYGGSFWDAMFPQHNYYAPSSPSSPSSALPNLLFLVTMLLLPLSSNSLLTYAPSSSTATIGRTGSTVLWSGGGCAESSLPLVVAVTREDGKNDKLLKQIQQDDNLSKQLEMVELPARDAAERAGPATRPHAPRDLSARKSLPDAAAHGMVHGVFDLWGAMANPI